MPDNTPKKKRLVLLEISNASNWFNFALSTEVTFKLRTMVLVFVCSFSLSVNVH